MFDVVLRENEADRTLTKTLPTGTPKPLNTTPLTMPVAGIVTLAATFWFAATVTA